MAWSKETIRFPCTRLPETPRDARLLGIYPQRQEGLFMQRVRIPGGCLRVHALRGLARIARETTPDYPLHVTTRQDIEFHGLKDADIPAVQAAVAGLGLSSVGACGDGLRNVTVCPGNGLEAGTWDVTEFVLRLIEQGESLPWILDLPRKFKVCVSGCPEACARPWTNDFGLAANADGTFRAVLAGSLGPHPCPGIVLEERLDPTDAGALLRAALRLFQAEGDRKDRRHARLRHVRQRVGDAEFRQRILDLFQEERAKRPSGTPPLRRVEPGASFRQRLRLPLGDIRPDDAIRLADAAEESGAEVRVGLAHDLFLFSFRPLSLPADLAALEHRPVTIACPGRTWCTRGIADSRSAAEEIARAVPSDVPIEFSLAGCPNSCSRTSVSGIGLVGRLKKVQGVPTDHFRLLAGGDGGCGPALSVELHPAVPASQVADVVRWLVDEYQRDETARGDSFGRFIHAHAARLSAEIPRRFSLPTPSDGPTDETEGKA